jgi:hypothetical protein
VRDEENRIFYVVPRSDGKGYYASLTRNGSTKDESRYLDLEKKDAIADVHKREEMAVPVHNAMGRQRKETWSRRLVYLVILGALAYAAWTQKDRFMPADQPVNPDQTQSPAAE